MAKNENTTTTADKAPKKRRWYHNLIDAYKITKRTFPWVGWLILGITVLVTGAFVALAIWQKMNIFITILFAVTLVVLIPTVVLAALVKKAMYRQVAGTVGSVYAVITQIRRGWIVTEEPIAANRHQDLVWRVIGRPGVVLITEGPTGRVRDLVDRERKLAQRVVTNVPVHVINVGETEGQVKLEKLEMMLRRLPKALHRNEVPEVASRIQAVSAANKQAGMPHGIDPSRAKMSRRALRGK
ncbi:MAG: DUF4191 domain-containing protein [Actinomycetaceae bacterium]|nr:DUF4191 domain-containing protein [Actinomycetaceae bacterium]